MDYVSCQISSGSPGRSDLSRGWSSPCVSETQHVTESSRARRSPAHAALGSDMAHAQTSARRRVLSVSGLARRRAVAMMRRPGASRDAGRGTGLERLMERRRGRGLVRVAVVASSRFAQRQHRARQDTRDSTGHRTPLSRAVKDTRDSTGHRTPLSRAVKDTRDSTGHRTPLSIESGQRHARLDRSPDSALESGQSAICYGPVSRDDSYRYSSFMTASMFHSGRAKTRQTRERDRFVRAESWSTDDRPHCTQRSAPRHRKLSTLSDG